MSKQIDQAGLVFGDRRGAIMVNQLWSQWTNPSDILSLLLLIGGDVVQRALAQQTGDWWPTPVVFSFGWVAYSFLGLLSAVGDNKLLPPPDLPSIVFSTAAGYVRDNQSWIIGRIIRDFEHSWMPPIVQRMLDDMLREAKKAKRPCARIGLCISVFEASPDATAGVPHRDLYWKSGYLVAVAQLVIAAIPWFVWGEWPTFAITAAGTVLAFVTGSLPQWRRERWSCRRNSKKTFVLTRGNGAQHVLVILGEGRGLDLEDLASAGEGCGMTASYTRWSYAGLATLWVVLLITVSGMKDQHTWFLLAVGAVGMLHTFVVAGSARNPEAFGIHLRFREVFVTAKVMATLKRAEEAYPGLGRSMLSTFFPGELREDEQIWWKDAKLNEDELKKKKKASAPKYI